MGHLAKARPDDGHFSTCEVRKSDEPCLFTSRTVALPKGHYEQPPNLAAGFSALHISCHAPVRANLIADKISTETFNVGVESWGAGVLFEANVTWIEHKAGARDCVFGQFDTADASESPARSAAVPKAKSWRHVGRTSHVPQKYSKAFFFPRPFKEPPEVMCWLNRLDLSSGPEYNYKIRAFADEVSTESFMAHLNTWDDCELNGAAMCWIVWPKAKKHVDSGKISTNDVRKRTNPRPRTSAIVKFKQRFGRVPTVLAALNMFDCAGNADLRVKLSITEVDRDGFRWILESWSDSTLYAASASWVALGFDY